MVLHRPGRPVDSGMLSPAERLRSRIRERGRIPFAEFMEEALYGEGGYYAGDRAPPP